MYSHFGFIRLLSSILLHRTCAISVSILLFASSAFAADYYISDCANGADNNCVAGNDANNGTSPNSPWRTYSRAQAAFSGLNAGDSIRFAQGGSFIVTGATTWFNRNCRANNRCTVRDYTAPWASGNEGRPIITNNSGGIFTFSDGGVADLDRGVNILNLELRGNHQGAGVSFFNDTDDVLLDNLVIDGFRIGVHISGFNDPPNSGSNGYSERITLSNSRIVNNESQGFLGGGDGCVVENNYFENNGFDRAILDHNIYWSGSGPTGFTVGGRISGNELYRSAFRLNNQGQMTCQGTSLVAHGKHRGLVIEDNLVREDPGTASGGCWGIAIDGGHLTSEHFDDLIIRRNKVINVGSVGIGCQGCTNSLIENNVIIQETGTAIAVPNRLNRLDSPYIPDVQTTNVTIRNNSIYTATANTGIRLGTNEGSSFELVSNAIYYTGASSSWNCFDLGRPNSSYESVDNNLCYFPNAGSSAEWEQGSGVSPNPLQAFRNSTPFGDNSIIANPLFASPGAPQNNLSISSASSPVVNAGHSSRSSTNDFLENIRGSNPDIGAFEQGGSTPDTLPPESPSSLSIQ